MVLLSVQPAIGSETNTYTYDARGRLVQVFRTGAVNNGINSSYCLDKADNRANVTVGSGISSTPTFSITGATASEGNAVLFTVTKCPAATATLTVNYATSGGTATSGTDFTSTSGTLSFLAGDTSKVISVPTASDATVESPETFTMTLSNASAGSAIGTAAATGTITDNSSPSCTGVSFAMSTPAAVTEGGTVLFIVNKSGTTTGTCNVNYATANGTATAGSDYAARSGSMSFLAGDTSKSVIVSTIDDSPATTLNSAESAETFTMSLSSPTGGATVGTPGSATATINDNDAGTACAGIRYIVNDSGGNEGTTVTLTVYKAGLNPGGNCSVSYATVDNTAVAPGDYTAVSGTLTFLASEASKNVGIAVKSDGVSEPAELLLLALSNPTGGASLDRWQGHVTINASGGAPSCSGISFTIASNGPVTEGTNSVFTVTKSGTTSSSCSVNYGTANGTATVGSDYMAASGTLTFSSAQATQTFSVTTTDDGSAESPETLVGSLSSPSGGAVLGSPNSATGTINDNDSAGTCNGISFTIASNGAVTEGTDSLFTVTKGGTTSNTCSVNYATTNGTATAGSDYTAASGALIFSPGQTTQGFSVVTIGDGSSESAETFTGNLSSPSGGATLGSPSSATATINNDSSGNNAPTPANDFGTQQKCTSATYNVVANDTDPNGDYPLTVISVTGNRFSVSSSSTIDYNALQSGGTGTYTVRDSKGATNTATLSVSVTGTCQ